jgi:translation elongation factor EF-Tu-like GTPase
VEQGVIKTGDNVEIVGWKEPLKAVVTGAFEISSSFLESVF